MAKDKERLQSLPKVELNLKTTLEDIPESKCGLCGGKTKKVYVKYQLGVDFLFVSEKTAGYRCLNKCGVDFLSHEAVIEALGIVKNEMNKLGKTSHAELFEDALALELKLMQEKQVP